MNKAVEKVEQAITDNKKDGDKKRAEKLKVKEDKRVEKAKKQAQALREKHYLQDERVREKQVRKEEKERIKEERKNSPKSHGNKRAWLGAVISLSVATFVLASVLTYVLIMPTSSDKAMESLYRKSFYDTVEQVDNIDLNLSKTLATSDDVAKIKYLNNTAINSELCENDLQQLPLADENKFYTTKLINQIGDYSKYLSGKLTQGTEMSEQDYAGLRQLYNANRQLKNSLQEVLSKLSVDFSFASIGTGDIITGGFTELQNLSVEYPELIYDGPFSDGQTDRDVKGLSGEKITEKQAKDIFLSVFPSYTVVKTEISGDIKGEIKCYGIDAVKGNKHLYAQVSETGGKLISFAYAGDCNGIVYDGEYAENKAIEFVERLGVKNMKGVWFNLADNVYTVNLAYTINGIIVYSDLIKVRVCAESGTVLGMEASSYYKNHVEREIGEVLLTEEQAKAKVYSEIDISTCRLAIVPVGKSEKLAYEISGVYDDSIYYVYIDAVTGRQVEMFKVIESSEGTLLM